MLAFRVALTNSTNSPCSSSRPTPIRSLLKPASRKSAPTCTVSLANAGANEPSASSTSVVASGYPSTINLIPFPSSPEYSDSPISQPDRTCLLLLRQSSDLPSQPRTRSSPVLQSPQERRRRSTARLQLTLPTTAQSKSGVEPTCQPPRKRPRLHKDVKQVKRRSLINSPDLQFMAIVQRSIAGAWLSRQGGTKMASTDRSQRLSFAEAQDELLASRLRSHLLCNGFNDADLIDTRCEPRVDSAMDVDAEMHYPSEISVDMDIDVESPEVSVASPTPKVSPCRPILNGLDRFSTSQLVATLIMRRHTQKPCRSSAGPERIASERRPSPLAAPST